MAFVGSVNNTYSPSTPVPNAFVAIKTALLAAGWVIQGSSNGTSTWSNASSVDNTGNFAANNSWLRIREPSGPGGREYLFFRGSATAGMIKYSRSVGFGTGGGLTTAPTTGASGDGVVWLGTQVGFSATYSGTNTYDQAATGAGQCVGFDLGPSAGYISCVASDTATNGVYGWWLVSYAQGTGTLGGIIYTDAVAAGSCPVTDYDPSYRQAAASTWWSVDVSTNNRCHYWQAYPAVWASPTTATYRIDAPGYSYFAATDGALSSLQLYVWPASSGATGLSIYNEKPQLVPYLISIYNLIGSQPKGFTSNVLLAAGPFNATDTLDLTAPTARIVIAAFTNPSTLTMWLTFPWVQNVLPLV